MYTNKAQLGLIGHLSLIQDNITLAGESAGAIFVHAHLITGRPVKRAVLASGSLYLSSPLPITRGNAFLQNLERKVQAKEHRSLRDCSAKALLDGLNEIGIQAMWLQEDEEFDNWDSKVEQVEELMIGDVEYEVNILPCPFSQLASCLLTDVF
jgi:carboxylesterase type B